MPQVDSLPPKGFELALTRLIKKVTSLKNIETSFCVKESFVHGLPCEFLMSLKGVERFFFQSREGEQEFFGLGSAQTFCSHEYDDVLNNLEEKKAFLNDDQIFFGGLAFDEKKSTSIEWSSFKKAYFVLPILLVQKNARENHLVLSYCDDSTLPFNVWKDHALSILYACLAQGKNNEQAPFPKIISEIFLPNKNSYAELIEKSLHEIHSQRALKKVVIARRNELTFSNSLDPLNNFHRLRQNTPKSFRFFFDNNRGPVFFGASPERLFKIQNSLIQSESIAGTRPVSSIQSANAVLEKELFINDKENREHQFVSSFIEEGFNDLGIKDIQVSKLNIIKQNFVQHLIKSYQGKIPKSVTMGQMIKRLHPTSAVCGIGKEIAQKFIRENENFDRGFYAGPIGIVGKNFSEFAVALRSALYFEKKLFIYAGGGIVAGSNALQEWEEINAKQKSIRATME